MFPLHEIFLTLVQITRTLLDQLLHNENTMNLEGSQDYDNLITMLMGESQELALKISFIKLFD